MNKNGLVLWEGPSVLNGEPIVAIATGFQRSTKNDKIGKETIQVWYLHRDISPNVASREGQDKAVCGDCIHRPSTGGACYVITFQAPLAIWKAYKRGSYAQWDGSRMPFLNRRVRFGAYGDPAAVPKDTLLSIRKASKRHMGYTHQWKDPAMDHLRDWCMASADSAPDYLRARSKGWRTFRVRSPDEQLLSNERMCPASEESPVYETMDCGKCGGCDGLTRGAKRPNYAIIVHGIKANRFIEVQS